MMRAGGNQKLRDWFASHDIPMEQRISTKYNSPAAELFRERYVHPSNRVIFSWREGGGAGGRAVGLRRGFRKAAVSRLWLVP